MDDRFKKILSDPKFRTIKKKDRKTKIDQRFKSMFVDDKFTLKYARDKRGKADRRHLSEDYKRFYRLSEDEDDIKEEVEDVKIARQKKNLKKKVNKKKDLEKQREKEEKKEDDEDNDPEEIDDKIDDKDDEDVKHEEEEEEEEEDDEEENAIPKAKFSRKLTHNLGYHRGMRGEDDDDDDASSSSSSESEEEPENEELEHEWNELDRNAERGDGISRRVAICNADWDRINAQDIFVLLNSFKPPTGVIESVKVYYSKFGEERLKIEETKGPSEFIYGKGECIVPKDEEDDDDEDDDENDDDDEEENSDKEQDNMEKLRKYQLERLKYFFALVTCDSPETGDAIYKELDGMEYESSSTTLDLRFVPDDMDFDDVKLKEECSSMPNSNYKPPEFINTALQQSQVKLTWDETDPKRKQIFDKAFEKDLEDDLKVYLASSSDEDDEVVENDDDDADGDLDGEQSEDKIAKYKKLLCSLDKDDDEVDMEVTWDPNLKDKILNKDKQDDKEDNDEEKKHSNVEEGSEDDEEDSEDDVEDNEEEDSPSEEEQEEEKESKNKRKNFKNNKKNKMKNGFEESELNPEEASKLELLMMDVDNNNTEKKRHFNYKEIVDKYSKNQPVQDDFKFNAEDPRFSAIYNSHLYNVDQSDPNFKRTDAFKQIIENKKKRGPTKYQQSDNSKNIGQASKPEPAWKSLAKKVKLNVETKKR